MKAYKPIEQAAEAADREAADSGTRHPSGNAEPRAGAPQGVLASAAADLDVEVFQKVLRDRDLAIMLARNRRHPRRAAGHR